MRRLTSGAAAFALAALTICMTGAPASAVVNPTVVRTIHNTNAGWGGCLDSNQDGKVYVIACNGGNFQKWQLYRKEVPGYNPLKLRNVATGLCLDSYDSRIYTHSCNDGDFQRWNDYPQSNLRTASQISALPNRATGRCFVDYSYIDTSGTHRFVGMRSCFSNYKVGGWYSVPA